MDIKTVKSLSTFISYIMDRRDEMASETYGGNSMWFFRGQCNSDWDVVPNIFRKDLSTERIIIENAIRHNPFDFKNLNDFETLTKLQHYGLGTRLLDISLNPLVALYFATEPYSAYIKGKNNQYVNEAYDGAIYFSYLPWKSLNEVGARIASSIPFVEFSQNMTLGKMSWRLLEGGVISQSEKNYIESNNYMQFIEYIQNNSVILSDQSNERLIRQSGAFIVPTSINVIRSGENASEWKLEKSKCSLQNMFTYKIIIPASCKKKIREELDFFIAK